MPPPLTSPNFYVTPLACHPPLTHTPSTNMRPHSHMPLACSTNMPPPPAVHGDGSSEEVFALCGQLSGFPVFRFSLFLLFVRKTHFFALEGNGEMAIDDELLKVMWWKWGFNRKWGWGKNTVICLLQKEVVPCEFTKKTTHQCVAGHPHRSPSSQGEGISWAKRRWLSEGSVVGESQHRCFCVPWRALPIWVALPFSSLLLSLIAPDHRSNPDPKVPPSCQSNLASAWSDAARPRRLVLLMQKWTYKLCVCVCVCVCASLRRQHPIWAGTLPPSACLPHRVSDLPHRGLYVKFIADGHSFLLMLCPVANCTRRWRHWYSSHVPHSI